MIEFECVHCGEREEKAVLPGKHAVLGAVATLNREAECCEAPEYRDSTGFRETMIDTKLRDLVPGIA